VKESVKVRKRESEKAGRRALALLSTTVFLFTSSASQADEQPAAIPVGYKLLYEQTFEQPGALKDFVFTDPNAWKLSSANGNSCLELFKQSKYTPKHRSPFNIALIADKVFGDFVLEVDLQSTVKP